MSAQCLFDLLVSLEGETQDALEALELVKAEKPLRSLGKMAARLHVVNKNTFGMCSSCARFFADFCYGNEDLAFSISEAIKLCVTVVAYAPESFRRCQLEFTLSFPLFFCPTNTCLQPPDADGAGGLGALLPAEAEEQHSHDGIRVGCQGRDRSHCCPGHFTAGSPLQL